MFETVLVLTLIFVSATIMLLLFDKLGQPAIPAYIVAGIVMGFFIDGTLLLDLVQLGILFLTFILGVRSGSEEVIRNIHYGIRTTLVQLVIIFSVAFGLAYLLGFNYLNATYFSIAAALSSTLVGSEYRLDFKELNVVYRRISESINVIEDFVAILIILIISIVPISLVTVGISLLYGLLIIAMGYVVRQVLFPWLVRLVKASSEFVMLIGLSFLAGFIGLCIFLEVSIIVGAFASGMALSRHPYEIKVLDTMGSLMDFFSVIFFVTLGALLSLPDLDVIIYAGTIIVITVFVKPFLIMQLLIWEGYNKRTAINAALQLDHVSEFALMIAIQASLLGFIEASLFNAVVVAAVVTMTFSSYTSAYSDFIYQLLATSFFSGKDEQDKRTISAAGKLTNHIIVVGFGVKGQKIVETLVSKNQRVLVIEHDPELIARLRFKKYDYLFSDALDTLTWMNAMVGKARLVIVTAPKLEVSEAALKQDTQADIIVSSYEVREAKYLLDQGAVYVNIVSFLARDNVANAVKMILEGNRNKVRNSNIKHMKEQHM